MARDLTGLFSPKSVCVIGASRNQGKVGAIVLTNIINSGFKGEIYPVNPNINELDDLNCFSDVAHLPQIPDLAVIAIPAPSVLDVLTEVGEKGIKNAVVFSAGFKETGDEGSKLENQLINIASKNNINILGPNCLGFVNNQVPINVTFSEVAPQRGNLRFISQSGAIASSLFDWCKTNNLGFSQFITLGNKAVINENDVLEYFQNQKPSTPIGLYLESISKGSQFLKLTSEISKTNPIFVLKPGKTEAAAKAMQSHTGAIAGEDNVLDAALAQAGVIRCQTLEDFFDLSRSLSWNKSPKGDKVAIISNAGGPAVISADAVVNEGLRLAEFDEKTHRQLQECLPRFAGILNPVDVLGDALADRYAKAAEIVLQNDQVNSLVVILTPQIMTQIEQTAQSLGKLSEKYQKPIFCSFIGGSLVLEGEQELNKLKIPSFRFPERAIWAIGKMWWYMKHQSISLDFDKSHLQLNNLDQIHEILKGSLDNIATNKIVSLAGISTPKTAIVSSIEEAKSFAKENGYPIVLKLSSPSLLHKKVAGGVVTDIEREEQLENVWEKIGQLGVDIQIQKDIHSGIEVIIGVKKDPNFGQVLLFGAGGSYAQLLGDRNLHLLPVNLSGVKNLVENSKIYPALPKTTLNKLFETIIRLGQLALDCPEISEIEINPAIVTSDNVWAVDCKVVI